jgi:hypothetical protein
LNLISGRRPAVKLKKKQKYDLVFPLGSECKIMDRAGEVGIGIIIGRTFEEHPRYDLRMGDNSIKTNVPIKALEKVEK